MIVIEKKTPWTNFGNRFVIGEKRSAFVANITAERSARLEGAYYSRFLSTSYKVIDSGYESGYVVLGTENKPDAEPIELCRIITYTRPDLPVYNNEPEAYVIAAYFQGLPYSSDVVPVSKHEVEGYLITTTALISGALAVHVLIWPIDQVEVRVQRRVLSEGVSPQDVKAMAELMSNARLVCDRVKESWSTDPNYDPDKPQPRS